MVSQKNFILMASRIQCKKETREKKKMFDLEVQNFAADSLHVFPSNRRRYRIHHQAHFVWREQIWNWTSMLQFLQKIFTRTLDASFETNILASEIAGFNKNHRYRFRFARRFHRWFFDLSPVSVSWHFWLSSDYLATLPPLENRIKTAVWKFFVCSFFEIDRSTT